MALLTLGSIVTDIRKSIGGVTYSRNKGGSYARARTVPVNPRTPLQTQVRANFASNAKLWSGTMTAAERAAWTAFAAANPLVNVLGASIIVSGLSMSMKLNQVLKTLGLAPIVTPPASLAVPPIAAAIGATAVHATPALTVETNAQATSTTTQYYIFATPPLAAGKKPPQSAYRFIYAPTPSTAATTLEFHTEYIALFGPWLVGSSIGVLVAQVNVDSGAVTPGLIFNVTST